MCCLRAALNQAPDTMAAHRLDPLQDCRQSSGMLTVKGIANPEGLRGNPREC
jgi:hypothetical protein